jgi:hypothetical protein
MQPSTIISILDELAALIFMVSKLSTVWIQGEGEPFNWFAQGLAYSSTQKTEVAGSSEML